MNHVRSGLFAAVAFAGLMNVVLQFNDEMFVFLAWRQQMTDGMVGGIFGAALLFGALSHLRMSKTSDKAVMAFR